MFKINNKAGVGEIYLYDEIGMWGISAADFQKELKVLDGVDTIKLYINSPGGDVYDGIAIANSLLKHPAKIEGEIDSLCASIATIISTSCDTLTIADNARYMIHNPWTVAFGEAKDFEKAANLLAKVKEDLITTYQRKVDKSDEELSQIMDDETWLSAEEAVEMGFVDSVTEGLQLAAHYDVQRAFKRFKNKPEIDFEVREPEEIIKGTPVLDSWRERIERINTSIK